MVAALASRLLVEVRFNSQAGHGDEKSRALRQLITFLRLQHSTRLHSQNVERHLQLGDGGADLGMLAEFILQGLQDFMGAGNMLRCLSRVLFRSVIALCFHRQLLPRIHFQFYTASAIMSLNLALNRSESVFEALLYARRKARDVQNISHFCGWKTAGERQREGQRSLFVEQQSGANLRTQRPFGMAAKKSD